MRPCARCAWERAGFLAGKKQVLRSCREGALFHRCWGEAVKSGLQKSFPAKFSKRPNPHLSCERSTAPIRLQVRDRRSQSFGEILFWRRKCPHLGIRTGVLCERRPPLFEGKTSSGTSLLATRASVPKMSAFPLPARPKQPQQRSLFTSSTVVAAPA